MYKFQNCREKKKGMLTKAKMALFGIKHICNNTGLY